MTRRWHLTVSALVIIGIATAGWSEREPQPAADEWATILDALQGIA
jgi:hypothetical protein